MPIYEYICENCKEELEVIQKVSDTPLMVCPSCRTHGLKKKTSIAAFHLKGGGWYKDGYANGSSHANGSEKSSDQKASTDTPVSATENTSGPATATAPEAKSSSVVEATPTSKAS